MQGEWVWYAGEGAWHAGRVGVACRGGGMACRGIGVAHRRGCGMQGRSVGVWYVVMVMCIFCSPY